MVLLSLPLLLVHLLYTKNTITTTQLLLSSGVYIAVGYEVDGDVNISCAFFWSRISKSWSNAKMRPSRNRNRSLSRSRIHSLSHSHSNMSEGQQLSTIPTIKSMVG